MRNRVIRIVAGLWLVSLSAAGCSTKTPITIQGPAGKVEISVLQDGQVAPRRGGSFHLQPRRFVLHLRGAVQGLSYYVVRDRRLTEPLEKIDGTLVFFAGTGARTGGAENLMICRERIEPCPATAEWFRESWGDKPEDAERNAAFLADHTVNPFVTTFSHYYFPVESAEEDPKFHLENFRRLADGGTEGDYVVRTIDDRPVGQERFVRVVLFLDHAIGQDFSTETWRTLDLRFARPPKVVDRGLTDELTEGSVVER